MGTLRVAPGDGPLRAEHERLLRTALRRGHEPPERRPGETVDRAAYDGRALTAARRVWTQRMVHEHQSAAVFAGLVPQLMEAGATVDVKTTALRAAMDELRHGGLCAGVVEALGGEAAAEVELAPAPLPTHPGCTPLERVMRNALFVGCLAETVAVAFTTEEREGTREPLVRRAIDQICADESLHARFGWSFVREAMDALEPDAVARTERWLRVAFRYLEREEMNEVPPCLTPPDELRAQGRGLGVCDNDATRALFYETVEQVIVPGLEAAGLGAADAWRRRGES